MAYYAIHAIQTSKSGYATGDWEVCPMGAGDYDNPSDPEYNGPHYDDDYEELEYPDRPGDDEADWEWVTKDREYAIEFAEEIYRCEGPDEDDEYCDSGLFIAVRELSSPQRTRNDARRGSCDEKTMHEGLYERVHKGKDIWTNEKPLKKPPARKTIAVHYPSKCQGTRRDDNVSPCRMDTMAASRVYVGGSRRYCSSCNKRYGRNAKPALSAKEKSEIRERLFKANGEKCPMCDRKLPLDMMQLDRIIPGSQGGQYTDDNVQCICRTCNNVKGGSVGMSKSKIKAKTLALAKGQGLPT